MTKNILLILSVFFFFIACDDDDNSNKDLNKQTKEYLPLSVGNYWIYEVKFYSRDQNGIRLRTTHEDTVTVIGEKTVRGKKFFVRELKGNLSLKQGMLNSVVTTDSAGYIVRDNGMIIFSNTNFKDTLYRYESPDQYSPYTMTGKMKKVEEAITVPAGTFRVLDLEQTAFFLNKPPSEEEGAKQNPKFIHTYFSKGVGIVFHTSTYAVSDAWIEWKLKKYHISGENFPKN